MTFNINVKKFLRLVQLENARVYASNELNPTYLISGTQMVRLNILIGKLTEEIDELKTELGLR